MSPKVIWRGNDKHTLWYISMNLNVIENSHGFIKCPNGVKLDE